MIRNIQSQLVDVLDSATDLISEQDLFLFLLLFFYHNYDENDTIYTCNESLIRFIGKPT